MSRRVRVADVVGSRVMDASGRVLGHVVELELGRDYKVEALLWGSRGWLSRLHLTRLLTGHRDVDRAAWDQVERLGDRVVRLRP